jgi:hypothetical protein
MSRQCSHHSENKIMEQKKIHCLFYQEKERKFVFERMDKKKTRKLKRQSISFLFFSFFLYFLYVRINKCRKNARRIIVVIMYDCMTVLAYYNKD